MAYRATVWNENVHEQEMPAVRECYPDGIHGAIAAALEADDDAAAVRTATLQEPDHGLTEDVLSDTDVLTWWGHMYHDDVADEVVDRVQDAVLDGMGLVVLHSGHYSKIFRRLMGTSCSLRWDEADERERLWVTDPAHPVASGLPASFTLPETEMYGEFFDIPHPDATVFISEFENGGVFRSGCAYHRGRGRVFYFRPGHETYPIYHDETVRAVLRNACRWAAADGERPDLSFGQVESRLR